jgi:hypothetical protein
MLPECLPYTAQVTRSCLPDDTLIGQQSLMCCAGSTVTSEVTTRSLACCYARRVCCDCGLQMSRQARHLCPQTPSRSLHGCCQREQNLLLLALRCCCSSERHVCMVRKHAWVGG